MKSNQDEQDLQKIKNKIQADSDSQYSKKISLSRQAQQTVLQKKIL